MDARGQENLRRKITLDSGHVLRPGEVWRKARVKTEEENEEEPHDAPLYPDNLCERPADIENREDDPGEQQADLEGVDCLVVVIKTEPEEINPPIGTGGVSAQECEDVPNVVPAHGDECDRENEDRHSLHELEDVPSVVVIKTEQDLQRLKCELDHEKQQEEPHLPPLCKTDPDTVKVTHPLYRGGDQQTKIHMWSIQHVEMPERAGDHEDLDTSDACQSSSADGNSVQEKEKEVRKEGERGPCIGHLDRSGKEQRRWKSYLCPECGSTFSKSSAFYRHMRIHTGKKLYQCSHCDKSFTQSRSFKTHERTHTGEKPYRCSQCGKTFTRKDVLQVHERTHTGEKPYPCSQCSKSFARLDVYQNHQRIHTGEKPYQCSQCAKTFTRLDVYQNHQRIHTGEKPYQCSICGRRLLYLSNLKNHERTHTKERPYQCCLCDKTFIQSGHLTKHLKTHTAERT